MNWFCCFLVAIGPWITNVSENGFSVLWTTDEETVACIELSDGTRFYEEYCGRRVASKFHSIYVSGLDSCSSVDYKVINKSLTNNVDPRRPEYGLESVDGPYNVRLFNSSRNSCRFSVMNDMHMNRQKYSALASQIPVDSTDFLFLNGDIISNGHYCMDTLVSYEIGPINDISPVLPVMFARGNHEGRGSGVRFVEQVYPNNGELPYTYMFREGPAAFLVLDAGETGVKNSLHLAERNIYDKYIMEQVKWAQKAMESPEWKNAKVRICMLHVPMIENNMPGEREVYSWMNSTVVPVLNESGVDLMISGDLHVHLYVHRGSMGNMFPIVVNDNNSRLEVQIIDNSISIRIFDQKGKIRHTYNVKAVSAD